MLEKLDAPPITEVACGFIFEPIADLDPIVIGTYWERRRDDFPAREFHPPIADGPLVFPNVPIRCWLVAADEIFLLQIQSDRFYVNWRRRGADYPRFSDHPGKAQGILSLALNEYAKFSAFCKSSLSTSPTLRTLDLSKIDYLIKGTHWDDLADLVSLIPWLKSYAEFSKSGAPDFAVRFSEQRESGTLLLSIDSATTVMEGKNSKIVKLESRMANVPASEPRAGFEHANQELNEVFAALIPEGQRNVRFGNRR